MNGDTQSRNAAGLVICIVFFGAFCRTGQEPMIRRRSQRNSLPTKFNICLWGLFAVSVTTYGNEGVGIYGNVKGMHVLPILKVYLL